MLDFENTVSGSPAYFASIFLTNDTQRGRRFQSNNVGNLTSYIRDKWCI